MPPDENRDAATLERISWELVRLRMEADAIGQPLLGFMLDQASALAGDELARLRLSHEGASPRGIPPQKAGAVPRPGEITP
jgi:hypothetical protein